MQRYIQTSWDEWGYNNPFTLIGAISFFMLFLSISKFYNKWINWLAAGTFAVYVVHCGDYLNGWFIKYVGQLANYTHITYGISMTVLYMVVVSIILLFSIATLDKLRAIVMHKYPIAA
jgi:hypothetical protein